MPSKPVDFLLILLLILLLNVFMRMGRKLVQGEASRLLPHKQFFYLFKSGDSYDIRTLALSVCSEYLLAVPKAIYRSKIYRSTALFDEKKATFNGCFARRAFLLTAVALPLQARLAAQQAVEQKCFAVSDESSDTNNEPYDDIDDLAFHPQTGQLFAIMNKGGTGGGLVELDPDSGLPINYIGLFTSNASADGIVDDMEGLAFFNDGTLYGSTGNNGPANADGNADDSDRLFEIDITNGAARLIGAFPAGVQDIEALGCLTAPVPEYEFRKFVNGSDANVPDGNDTPHLLAGSPVTWTYWITNTGDVAIPLASIVVTDSDLEVDPIFNRVLVGNADAILDPNEVFEYIATGFVPDPQTSASSSIIRNLCSTDSEDEREWGYKNIGTLTIDSSFTLTDPAHICIPMPPSLDANRDNFYEFSYTVTNPAAEDGGVPLKNIKVQSASQAVSIDCGDKTTLNTNESMTCTASAPHIAFRNSRGWVTADPVGGGTPLIQVVLPDPVSATR